VIALAVELRIATAAVCGTSGRKAYRPLQQIAFVACNEARRRNIILRIDRNVIHGN
jgi:hypothetical protein